MQYTSNLALFLLEHTGSIYGVWQGHMPATKQRKLFGRFLGKGTLVIDGNNETLRMYVKVCFGLDYDARHLLAWREL